MIFRPFYRFETGCATYVFGCGGRGIACVVEVGSAVLSKPAGMEAILRFNQGRGA